MCMHVYVYADLLPTWLWCNSNFWKKKIYSRCGRDHVARYVCIRRTSHIYVYAEHLIYMYTQNICLLGYCVAPLILATTLCMMIRVTVHLCIWHMSSRVCAFVLKVYTYVFSLCAPRVSPSVFFCVVCMMVRTTR